MANNTAKTKSTDNVENATVKAATPTQESVYTAEELADNCKVFGTFREIVVVALRTAGKETATLSEAKNIIEKFKNREVK